MTAQFYLLFYFLLLLKVRNKHFTAVKTIKPLKHNFLTASTFENMTQQMLTIPTTKDWEILLQIDFYCQHR